jgi:hypothetical protein
MRTPARHLIPLAAAGLAAVVITAACVPGDDDESAAPAAVASSAPADHGTTTHEPTTTAPTGTPADRAISLQAMLGQHSVLAADVMRSRIRGDDDFVQAANAALGKNTGDMTALVGTLFGKPAADAFGPMWSRHIVELVNYAGAIGDEDEAAKKASKDKLVVFEGELAEFFSGASNGRLPLDPAKKTVEEHIDHLTEQADAYARKDYAEADELYAVGYEHTYDMGLTLAGTLLPPDDAKVLEEPIWRLRSTLGKLLSQHAVLIEDVTRAAVSNSADFGASGSQINANTEAIAGAIDTLFGAEAAKAFQDLWAGHVEQLVAYSAATAKKDADKQAAAKEALTGFETKMAAFLGVATGHKLSDADLASALTAHDKMLMQHADAYAAKDYQTAHDLGYQTFDHMMDLARTLADAFGETVAAKLPKGGAATGHGGEAGIVGHR